MPSYEKQDIFEYYPGDLVPEPDHSTLKIKSRKFKRFVFRPIAGHDILVNQILGDYLTGYLQHKTEEYDYKTKDELSLLISADLADYDDTKNWTPYAVKMAGFVAENGYECAHFYLEGVEGVGKLRIMDESKGWPNTCQQQVVTETCVICLHSLSDEVDKRLGMKCGHVFHKDCLAEWIWTNPHCPLCREGF